MVLSTVRVNPLLSVTSLWKCAHTQAYSEEYSLGDFKANLVESENETIAVP